MKKTLAIILSLALVICMMPAAAFADVTPVTPTAITLTQDNTTITVSDVVYNGTAQEPNVTVTLKDGTVLTKDKDYKVAYSNNTDVSENGAVVTITGIHAGEAVNAPTENITSENAGYYGTITKNFNIKPYDLETNKITISVDNKTKAEDAVFSDVCFYQNGVAVKNTNIFAESNFNLSNSADSDSKKYTVTLTGKTNVTGTLTTNFRIVNDIKTTTVVANTAGITVSSDTINAGAYDGKSKTISSLFYLKDVDKGNYRVTAKNSDGKVVTEAKDAGTYEITVTGMNDYAGTKKITLTIGKRDGSDKKLVTVDAISGQYSSSQFDSIVPVVRDTSLGVLSAGKDYSYKVESGQVLITFIGNYDGSQSVSFNLVTDDKDIAKIFDTLGVRVNGTATTTYSNSVMYSGYSQPVSVTVSNLSSSYYTIEYRYEDSGKTVVTSSPTDAHTYSIYIVGKNGYGGEKYLGLLTINPYKKAWVEVTASAGSTTSNPYVTVKSLDGKITFVKDKDYKVTNTSTSKYTGKVTVYIDTMGNIETGSLTATYALVAKSISSCSAYFTNGKSSSAYTGATISVPITVKDSYTVLTQGTDYTITYKNASGKVVSYIKDAGTYTIEITGKGLYSGTTYLTYTVTGNDISSYTVTLKEYSVNADGYVKVPVITSVARNSYTKLSSSDYTVSYQDADGKTVTSIRTPGTYKVIVTGAGKYSGSTYATFRVVGLSQSITGVESSYKVYPNDTLTLSPKATEGSFTYSSSDPSVATVSSTGVVTAYKAGRAKITITTTGNTKYDQVSKSTVIKVYPKKAVITKKPWTNGKKAQLKVRWNKQENVTRYEIRYSRSKSFAKGTYLTKKVNAANNDYTTQSTTIKNLKSGYTYYVKVRAVKEVYNDNGKKITYYGKWSGWRSVKVK